MRVAILHDDPKYVGGAELTMREFAAAAPAGVDLGDFEDADTVILGNITQQTPALIEDLDGRRAVWFHNDLSCWIDRELQEWLDLNAQHIFCSPLQRDKYGLDGEVIPPAMDLEPFHPRYTTEREGTCSIAQWRNPGKGAHLLAEWAEQNGPVDVYGDGQFYPRGENVEIQGPLEQDDIPGTLWAHERFVFLPFEVEPFCRCAVEAWAAGCSPVLNRLIGAAYYINEAPEKLESAASDFWKVVLR